MTGRLTAEERGDLAEAMVPVAAHIAVLVNGDGGPEEIADLIGGLCDQERNALIVVLAAMVDPDAPMPPSSHWPVADIAPRQIADAHEAEDEDDEGADEDVTVDHVAVDRWLGGETIELNPRERVAAIIEGKNRGLKFPEIDDLAGQKRGTTSSFVSMVRRSAPALGVRDPFGTQPQRQFDEATVIRIREASATGKTDLEVALAFGATRKAITDVINGSSYADIGGPIRPKRANKPNRGSLIGFARNNSSHYATAS